LLDAQHPLLLVDEHALLQPLAPSFAFLPCR
jgi:hypothetical protein